MAVNDDVMGGHSSGSAVVEGGQLHFSGVMSLENNGGFASVRTKAKKLGLAKGDVLVARVRGDGREYSMNLHVPKPLVAFSYRATVKTKKDEWIEVKLPLDKFWAMNCVWPAWLAFRVCTIASVQRVWTAPGKRSLSDFSPLKTGIAR